MRLFVICRHHNISIIGIFDYLYTLACRRIAGQLRSDELAVVFRRYFKCILIYSAGMEQEQTKPLVRACS